MRKSLAVAIVGFSLAALTTSASATNYTLWIHGRNPGPAAPTVINYNSWTYWGGSGTAAGVNKKSVNWRGHWDGTNSNAISVNTTTLMNALDCFCTGSNWCYIGAHSAGDNLLGYVLDMYGGSTRTKRTAGAGPTCASAGTGTQVGWNMNWYYVGSGAGGGSELADHGDWTTSEPLVSNLRTVTARAMYNHNQTRGKWLNRFAGASGTYYAAVLPGQDDEVVAYHSTGGVSGASGAAFCNPSDWVCNDLTLQNLACEGGVAKWTNNWVAFRDDAEAYNHFTNAAWAGITAVVRSTMVTNAL